MSNSDALSVSALLNAETLSRQVRIMILDTQLNNRVATAQGKQGIWFLLFPDRENTGNFFITQGKFLRHRENILTVFIDANSMFLFTYFQNFLASLCSA